MADTTTFQASAPATPPTGFICATDDCGAAGHVQVLKLAISTDGSATFIPADAANGLDVDVTRLPALPAGTNNIGDVDVLTMPTVTTKRAGTTGTPTSVASTTTTNTTLLAADSARFGVLITNDSTSVLFLLFGSGTESTSVYTVQVAAGGYHEVHDAYVTMRISGHWVSANGFARITTST